MRLPRRYWLRRPSTVNRRRIANVETPSANPNWLSRSDDSLRVVLSTEATLAWIFALALVLAGYSKCPFWDQWVVPYYLSTHSTISLSWLWAQHSEHRIELPKLILLADMRFFGARNLLPIALIFIVQTAHWFLLSRYLRTEAAASGKWPYIESAVLGMFMFLPGQLENFTWAFQIGFVLSFFFVSCSLVSLCQYHRSGGRFGWLLLSCLFPIASAMNLASGNVAWPSLLLLCFFLRARFRTLAFISLSGFLSILCYFYNFQWDQTPPHKISYLLNVRPFLRYITTYFGTSWWVVFPHEARAIAFTSFILLGYLIIRASLHRDSFSVAELFLISECFYLFSVACVTAFGRMSFGADQAAQGRYQTPALIFWACLFCTIIIRLRRQSRTKLLLCTQMLIALIGVKVALDAPNTWAINQHRTSELRLACQAFVRGELTDKDKSILCAPCAQKMFDLSRPMLLKSWHEDHEMQNHP